MGDLAEGSFRRVTAPHLSVLHVSKLDGLGGSARAAYRLHAGLKRLSVRSRMLVARQTTQDHDVDLLRPTLLRVLDQVCGRLTDRLSLQNLFYPSSFFLAGRRWFREADIIQLGNVHGGYFAHTALIHLSRRRPLVWRLDDMWPITGHCPYPYDCERWKNGCGSCPRFNEYPWLNKDTTATLWRIKRLVYQHSRLTIVVPSRWMARVVGESPLLGRFPIHVIPYGLDTEIFYPVPKTAARQVLGINTDSPVVLFVAQSLHDPRKGAPFFTAALGELARTGMPDITVLMVGASPGQVGMPARFRCKCLGFVEDDLLMAIAYSAADLLVAPSLAESFGQVFSEAMACGTPCVAFDTTAVPEVVRHMETGYLARYKDTADLAAGIALLLGDESLRARLGHTARKVAESEYGLEVQAKRYLQLYLSLLGKRVSNEDFADQPALV